MACRHESDTTAPFPGKREHPMHILITGGCGFLGVRLARTLLASGPPALAGAPAPAIPRLTLADRAPPPARPASRRPRAVRAGRSVRAGGQRCAAAGARRRLVPPGRSGERRVRGRL